MTLTYPLPSIQHAERPAPLIVGRPVYTTLRPTRAKNNKHNNGGSPSVYELGIKFGIETPVWECLSVYLVYEPSPPRLLVGSPRRLVEPQRK